MIVVYKNRTADADSDHDPNLMILKSFENVPFAGGASACPSHSFGVAKFACSLPVQTWKQFCPG